MKQCESVRQELVPIACARLCATPRAQVAGLRFDTSGICHKGFPRAICLPGDAKAASLSLQPLVNHLSPSKQLTQEYINISQHIAYRCQLGLGKGRGVVD